MALSDPRVASVGEEGLVGCAPASKEVVLEIKLLDFINEFLFTQTEECAHVVAPRLLVTRNKQYRSIWKSAVRSIMRNYSSDSESNDVQGAEIGRAKRKTHCEAAMPVAHSTPDLQGIPFQSKDRGIKCKPDIENGGSFTTDVVSKQEVNATYDAGEALLTKTTVPQPCNRSQPIRYLKQQIESQPMISSHLNQGDFAPQVRQDSRTYCCNAEPQAMELLTPVFRVRIDREVEGQAMAHCTQTSSVETDRKVSHTLSGAPVSETMTASFAKETVKPSWKKPPLPPRPHMLYPNSSQTSQVRCAKRARLGNRTAKRRKSAASGFNTPSLLALIVTVCFAAIMVVQGFIKNANVGGADLKAEVAPEAQKAFLTLPGDGLKLSPDQETWSHTLSGIHAATAEHGDGSSLLLVELLQQNRPAESVSILESSRKEARETIKHSGFTAANTIYL